MLIMIVRHACLSCAGFGFRSRRRRGLFGVIGGNKIAGRATTSLRRAAASPPLIVVRCGNQQKVRRSHIVPPSYKQRQRARTRDGLEHRPCIERGPGLGARQVPQHICFRESFNVRHASNTLHIVTHRRRSICSLFSRRAIHSLGPSTTARPSTRIKHTFSRSAALSSSSRVFLNGITTSRRPCRKKSHWIVNHRLDAESSRPLCTLYP